MMGDLLQNKFSYICGTIEVEDKTDDILKCHEERMNKGKKKKKNPISHSSVMVNWYVQYSKMI